MRLQALGRQDPQCSFKFFQSPVSSLFVIHLNQVSVSKPSGGMAAARSRSDLAKDAGKAPSTGHSSSEKVESACSPELTNMALQHQHVFFLDVNN